MKKEKRMDEAAQSVMAAVMGSVDLSNRKYVRSFELFCGRMIIKPLEYTISFRDIETSHGENNV